MPITPDTTELYQRPVSGEFSALCGGNSGNDVESCVTIAALAGGGYALRDTKLADTAEQPELRMSADEITKFAVGWLAQRDEAMS
ncbi:DUF397 domain-containing protein [Streptomyces castrisilvae]|uniref:DUF397 domain-containing protein n=1 Tax=Streptomyces castrisilvae TaxID=3033811 RepID=A0ABY9HJN7_9ACTN|nr:DUF397 domain-containing protein [Streptomyces sp. Mut1]WLQ34228.1 DUF397 domain-containing protein [Streptomyces sp. Mut1]